MSHTENKLDQRANNGLSCKLTSNDLRIRKETVLTSLRQQIIEKKELPDGYWFQFPGTDAMIDELVEFIKTERTCCDFFGFYLFIAGDRSHATLTLTGPEGSKEFITTELGF